VIRQRSHGFTSGLSDASILPSVAAEKRFSLRVADRQFKTVFPVFRRVPIRR
jgi:hypothetical protein